ncbi:unnamed protein product [Staurois parvus]|uniref:Uncharacterized protein n=1 Tax=Staurois parvus TaxID=386267 RepID=A0ABN9B7T4_9NEOB|nr:unnamed protein product [Staurois parvus]
MTRDCGQHRDDQRLRTAQMTADHWGGTPILPVPRSSRALSSRLL